MSRAAVLLLGLAAVAAEVRVRSVDSAKGTVTLQDGNKAATYPLSKLIVLPRPEGKPDFEPGELVDIVSDGKAFIVRRPLRLNAQRKEMLSALPVAEQAATERAAQHRLRAASAANSTLAPRTMKIGDVGKLPRRCVVLQVVDGSNARIEHRFDEIRTDFWIEGVDTKRLVEDREPDLPGVFKVDGTKRYESGAGSRQVLLVKPLDDKPLASAQDLAEADRFEQTVKDRQAAELAEQRKAMDRGMANAKEKSATEKAVGASEREEAAARLRLRLAKDLKASGKPAQAMEKLEQLIKDYPKTKAAEEARQLLKP